MQALTLVAALGLALRLPLVSLWIGAALFGVPHVLGGVRAVAVTRTLTRPTIIASGLGVLVGAAQLAGMGDAALRIFLWLFAAALAAEILVARRTALTVGLSLAALGVGVVTANASPRLAVVVLAHLHGVGSLAFYALAAHRRRLPYRMLVVGAGIVSAAAITGLLDGAMAGTLYAPRGAAASIANEAIGIAGRGVSGAAFHRGLFLYAFGQSLHFAVWLRLVPDLDRPTRVPKPLRRALAELRTDFGWATGPLLAIAAGAVLLLFAGGGRAREAYFALTYFHVGLEAAALVRLGLPGAGRAAAGAAALQTAPTALGIGQ